GGICKMALGREAKRLGSAGPVVLPRSSGSTIIAPSGDIVTNFGVDLLQEMYDIHCKAGAALTMVVTPVPPERRKDFGTVVLGAPNRHPGRIGESGQVLGFVEKDPD